MPVNTKYITVFICASAFFLLTAYVDLALRGRYACLEGDKYAALAMAAGPAGSIEKVQPGPKGLEGAGSAAKYAYIWYRTAAEDFSPPETRWTRRAREKMPEALALWERMRKESAGQKGR